jgi:hypothetical protein
VSGPIPTDEAHYAADRNGSGPGCCYRVFVRDETCWNWTREAASLRSVEEVTAWAAARNLKPVRLG